MLDKSRQTVKIGIVSPQFPIAVDNRIDCADFFCTLVDMRKIWDNRGFVRNGHVDGRKILRLKECIELLGFELYERIGVAFEHFVYLF